MKPDPRWADTVRLLRTADGFAEADITAMLEHAEDSTSWWHKLAASLPAMRSRSGNGKLKAENLLESARRATEGEGGGIDWDAVGREDPA